MAMVSSTVVGEVLLLGTRTLRYIQAGGGDGGDVAANARILVKKLASRQILVPGRTLRQVTLSASVFFTSNTLGLVL